MTAIVDQRRHAGVGDDDATLLERLRAGDVEPYAELWRRHLASAYRVAQRYRGRASAEDIVGEASLRVFDRIQAGDGPTSNFRGYFLTVVKSVALDLGKADLRLVPTDGQDLEASATPVPPYDATGRVDQDLVRVAFGRLSARDQQVLWHTAVLGAPAAVVGLAMGLSANGVSAAAMRARDALRAAYLDAHADKAMQRTRSTECRWVLSQMGRYVRGKLSAKRRARVERHLQDCTHAQLLVAELTEVNLDLPALLVPLIFVAATHGAAAWCAVGVTTGHHGPVPQSVPVDPASSALAGVGATATGLITKAAVVVTAAALGAGLTTSPGSGDSTIQQAHGAASATNGAPGPGGDGMPEPAIRGAEQTTTTTTIGVEAGAVPRIGDQPIATHTSVPPSGAAGAIGAPAALAAPDTAISTGGLTRAATPNAAPSTTSSNGTTGTATTTGTTSVPATVKGKKTSPTQPSIGAPPDPVATPTSTTPPAPHVPPGQAKKADPNTSPPPDSCKNAWSQAPACRTATPP